jgi:hypothetical protein
MAVNKPTAACRRQLKLRRVSVPKKEGQHILTGAEV